MKRTTLLIIAVALLVIVALAGAYFIRNDQPMNDRPNKEELSDRPDKTDRPDNEESEDSENEEGEPEEMVLDDAPFYFTTMTHMEGNYNDDINENMFWSHVDQLRYAMDMADEYEATLTIESEKPFARANTIWDHNMMQEVLDRGHGVGTHCDVGGPDPAMEAKDFAELLKENKDLVDDLVGPENNKGCSGTGGYSDWVTGAHLAGFDYIDGIVGFHLLAIEQKNRPDPAWDDRYILKEAYHLNIPEELEDRLYLMKLKDVKDFGLKLKTGL